MKKITIITGHYGSGKTNISCNIAMELAGQGKKVTIVDLDIVNPYFRTADFKELFEKSGITPIIPMYANSNLDIPAISFDLERIATEDGYLIIDVGGDDAGATALGRYKEPFDKMSNDIDMLYVVNCYRYMTRFSDEALELLQEIELAARIKATGIINNSNLGCETTDETVISSMKYASEIANKAKLPIVFTGAPVFCDSERLRKEVNPLKLCDVYVKPLWDE